MVKFLVSKGADIHAVNEYALRWSAGNGYLDVVKYLVSKGASVDKICRCTFIYLVEINASEDAEFIAQYLPNPIPENLVPKKFHKYALKYGIVYRGSNYPPMDEEYRKRGKKFTKERNIRESARNTLQTRRYSIP